MVTPGLVDALVSVMDKISKTQNVLIGEKVIGPVNLDVSIPPNVISPLMASITFVGLKDIPISLKGMTACAKSVSVTVGIIFDTSGLSVPWVRTAGPRLHQVVVPLGELPLFAVE